MTTYLIQQSRNKKITTSYLLTIFIAVVFTWIIHEFAHWAVSTFLGYETVLTLNSAYPVSGSHNEEWHSILISAAGPAATIIQALAVFGHLLYRGWFKYFYPFLFVPFYMRFLAGVMNFINLNDEGRISEYLNIGTFTLPLVISAGLFYMIYVVSKKFSLSWKLQGSTVIVVMVVSSILILADQFWSIRLI